MKINSMVPVIDNTYFEHDFLNMIEDHLTYLRENKITVEAVSNLQSIKYQGDLYGLLDNLGYQKKYHLAIARVNGFKNSNDFSGEETQLIIPDISYIDILRQIYKTKK